MSILKPIYVSTVIFSEYMVFFQGSLIKPNDPDETDFLSNNPDLIWGILIGAFLLLSAIYFLYRRSKRKNEEE